ncbi:MAG: methyltransferase domain-containing protein [Solirubrobacterales bacterium]|nr:methyltransferase domain-containing protein [Solirubrobacterales bacterium]
MSGFQNVDATGASAELAAYLDAASTIAEPHKRASIAALGLRRGDRALDVGCGLGDEVRLLADQVGPNGIAFGVDLSEHLLEAARARHGHRRSIRFIRADAHRLPFADREVDGARIERTLQHVADPAAVVRELARTVRPHGRIVAIEPDWHTLVFTGKDIATTHAVVGDIAAQIRHPAAGRFLPAWCDSARLVIERFEAHAIVLRSFALADQLLRLGAAVDRLATSAAEAWREEQRHQDVRGTFAASITSFMIVASAPGEQPEMIR